MRHSRMPAGSTAPRRRERAAGATAETTASTAQAPRTAASAAHGISTDPGGAAAGVHPVRGEVTDERRQQIRRRSWHGEWDRLCGPCAAEAAHQRGRTL
ncbi:hypothetical protein ACNFR7_08490 [Streptomyces sp. RM1]|uniref:hypothetical protein n=1 Tax=Streptomyces misionensis TaxID=67331 RepID=UPI003BAF4829